MSAGRVERLLLVSASVLLTAGALALCLQQESSSESPSSPNEPAPATAVADPAEAERLLPRAELLVREGRVRPGNFHRAAELLRSAEAAVSPHREGHLALYGRIQVLLQAARTGQATRVGELWCEANRARALRRHDDRRWALRQILLESPDPDSKDHLQARKMLGR